MTYYIVKLPINVIDEYIFQYLLIYFDTILTRDFECHDTHFH